MRRDRRGGLQGWGGKPGHPGASPSGARHAAHDPAAVDRDVAAAANGNASLRHVYPVGDWHVETATDETSLLLTLATPDGFAVSFCLPFDDAQRLGRLLADFVPGVAEVPPLRH